MKRRFTGISERDVMKLPRRQFLHLAAGAAALPSLSRVARAQAYPTRPVRMIVGFPPGGFNDTTARLIDAWLSEHLGQQFVTENRPGASANLATEAVVRAAPDGYTLLTVSDANAYNATLYDNLKFNFIRDGEHRPRPVCHGGRSIVRGQNRARVRRLPKANPGKVNMASLGPGTPSQLVGVLFKATANVDLLTVNYRGAGPALLDLMSSRVDVMFISVAATIGYIRSGKLRPLGVTTTARMDVLPDVPTIGEFVPGYEATGWVGIGPPTNTPPEIIAILNTQVNAALADATFKARLVDLGLEPFANAPAEFGKFIVGYTQKWAKVIRAANVKPE
jgi:tripartite-type tricarboxylate transporter receptor subunit TctC